MELIQKSRFLPWMISVVCFYFVFIKSFECTLHNCSARGSNCLALTIYNDFRFLFATVMTISVLLTILGKKSSVCSQINSSGQMSALKHYYIYKKNVL